MNHNLLPFEEVRLSNGIPVLLQHFEGPAAATYWWINVGSCDEAPKEAGFAHFLEHMLFKDAAAKETGKASTGQLARTIESLGGDINAYTSFDQTVYHVTCASHHWFKVIDAFSDMSKPQKFLKQDFESEREVIIEELRKNEDSPDRMMFQKLFGTTFKHHPYGKPVIGYVKTLKAAKVQDLEAFYKRNYATWNMGLILVGPINDEKGEKKKQLLALLEKKYGSKVIKPVTQKIKPKAVKPFKHESLNEKQTSVVVQHFDVQQPTISISFRVPALDHEDIPALDVLASVLGQGELSRIYQKLFYQSALVTGASGGMYVPSDPGMMYFQAETDLIEKIPAILAGIVNEIKEIQKHGPSEEELKRVLVNSESEKLYAAQTVDGVAGRIGFMRFTVNDLSFDEKYLYHLRSTDAESVRDVALKYLDFKKLSIVIQLPKNAPAVNAKDLEDYVKRELTVENPKDGKKIAPVKKSPVRFFELKSGIRIAHHERKGTPVFSIHASALGAIRLENPEHWGVSYLGSMIWAKGTETKSAQDVSRIIEGHASGMDGFSGRNSIGLQMTGLVRDWTTLSHLFTETLWRPGFNEDELNHHRRVVEDGIRSIEDHSSQLCSKLFLETLYENHPYGRMTTGSLDTVARISKPILHRYHRDWIRPSQLVISLSGAIKPSVLDHWLADLEKDGLEVLERDRALAPIAIKQDQIVDQPALIAPRWVEKVKGREQTHIIVGGLGSNLYSEDRYAMRILQTILGGQSGRLFIELREKKSLAYTVSPMVFEGIEKGFVGTYIACSPGKRQEALEGIKKVYEDLAKKGPTPKEMDRAREFYLGRKAMDLQSDGSIASHYGLEELYRLPRVPEEELVKRIRAITPKDVQRICSKYYVEPHFVTAVVS